MGKQNDLLLLGSGGKIVETDLFRCTFSQVESIKRVGKASWATRSNRWQQLFDCWQTKATRS